MYTCIHPILISKIKNNFTCMKNRNMVVFALTLIRHGETAHNKDNVIQGQLDVPLSQTGLRQAELLGFHLQYQQYSHVYASDLTRAMQTAEGIIRQNKSFKSALIHDHRLRERKFGIVEGKSFKFLREAAEKSNQNTGQYTPPGGETIQQVHERAVSFFHDICEMVKESSQKLESQSDPAKLSTNGSTHFENGKLSGQKRKWDCNDTDMEQNDECQTKSHSKIYVKESQSNEHQNLACQSHNFCADSPSAGNGIADVPVGSEKNVDCFKQNSSSISKQLEKHNNEEQFSIMFTDDIIRSQIMSSRNDLPNIECPNVSLSPLVDQNFVASSLLIKSLQHESAHGEQQNERRLSVCSSCDDVDSAPTLIANILVVSHGGWLRELFRHFVDELECSVPGGKKQALRISPNAGLSKFTVSLEDQGGHPKIICLQIHDKQHLSPVPYTDTFNAEEIAL